MRIYTVLSIVVLTFLVSVTACDQNYMHRRGRELRDDAKALAVEYIEANEWLRFSEDSSYGGYVSIVGYVGNEGEPSEDDVDSLLEDLIAMGLKAYAENSLYFWYFKKGIELAMFDYKNVHLINASEEEYEIPPLFEYYDMIIDAVGEGID